MVVFGEVGLSGEVRSVTLAEIRAAEALKLGFKKVMVPASNAAALTQIPKEKIIAVENLADAIRIL